MSRAHVIDHPLVDHHLAELRDRNTEPEQFRALVRRLTFLLTCEATRDLRTTPIEITTPLTEMQARRIAQRIAVVPILRAGLGMVDPLLTMLPGAEVWHLGVYRDEQTLRPVEYYHKLPSDRPPDLAMIIDPMLATGGSAVWAIGAVKQWGVPAIKLLSIIAAPEGIARVNHEHSDVDIFVCAADSHLNEHGYIVPGLGDAGDRIFNT